MTRAAKPAVIAVFTILWFIVSVQRVPERIGKPPNVGIDMSWVIALPEMLHQHSISGRDFHFTYGPLSQVIAYAGASLHTPWSASDSLPLIMLAFYCATIVLFAATLLLLRPLRWKHSVLFYAAVAALNLFSEPTAFRPMALILCAVLFIRAIHSDSISRIVGWSALTGAACFAAQLLTFELGPYGIATIVVAGSAIALRQKLRDRFFLCLGVVLAVYVAGNLGIDFAFYLSGSNYAFFDYQRYALETIQGFTFSQGLPWGLEALPTLGLALVGLFSLGVLFVVDRKAGESDLFLALLVCAAIELKSLTVRSDLGHITQSISPLLFVFLLSGAVFLTRWRVSKMQPLGWCAAFVVLWFSWPWAGNYFAADLLRAATDKSPFTKLSEIRAVSDAAASADDSRPMLAFPYENYIPSSMKRRLIAPVLMSYNASTERLQQFYVERLDQEPDLEVVYGVDGVVSKAVDDVPAITRVPMIFDYLHRHFRLSDENLPFEKGFYLLKRTSSPRQLDSMEVQASGPAACNLVRLTLQMHYSALHHIGRPTPVEVSFSKGGKPVLSTPLVALKPNAPFSTYISLIPADNFQEIFGSGPIAPTAWDKLEIAPLASDWLGVSPSRVEIKKLECLLAR